MYVITFLILQTVTFIHFRFVSLNKGYTKYSCWIHYMIMLQCALIEAKVSINKWMKGVYRYEFKCVFLLFIYRWFIYDYLFVCLSLFSQLYYTSDLIPNGFLGIHLFVCHIISFRKSQYNEIQAWSLKFCFLPSLQA